MLKTILVKDKELMEDGRRLLQELDRRGFPTAAALWYYVPERENWKLIIVTRAPSMPRFGIGPLDAYRKIQGAMAQLAGLRFSLDDILVMRQDTRSFEDLRRTMEGASRDAVARQQITLEGASLEDAYIYRWPND